MKRHHVFVIFSSVLAALLAVLLAPNSRWDLHVLAQSYTSTLDSVIVRPVNIRSLDGGPGAESLAYGLGPITDEMAYRFNAPEAADLLRGDETVNIFNVPPTDRIYPAPGDVESPEPVKVRTVDDVTLHHYFLLMIDGAYLYQVNVFRPDGTLANENLMYFVYPDGRVFWFYLNR
jgi:hypothetical protein